MDVNSKIADIKTKIDENEITVAGKQRFFSVLIPLIKSGDELFVLYEVRSKKIKRQPGEISFPGGAIEPGEDRQHCAIRETCEEIGLREEQIEILGEFNRIHTPGQFTIYSFVGVIDESALETAVSSAAEVSETFMVPLSYLEDYSPSVYMSYVEPKLSDDFPLEEINYPQGYKWKRGEIEIPVYRFENKAIWGLTARLTRSFLATIK